ncbi:MAG TPA: riboflavin kinase [Anaerolineae bacterium]|nr:riboflavin kinase [Anaerolineae bacterium]
MRIIRDLHQTNIERATVLTIGAFDGLHLGHQGLLRQLVHRARQTERLSGVVTFDPLPRAVLHPGNNAVCLTTPEEKAELLAQWGLDILAILPFTQELARTSAQDFVSMLCAHLGMTEMWVGWDFALGRERKGSVSHLKKLGAAMSFAVHVVEPVLDGEALISSTQIRKLLSAGRVREAGEMLGRYYSLRGRITKEPLQANEEGFTLVTVRVSEGYAMPASGAYAVYANIGDIRCPAMANIRSGSGTEQEGQVYLLDCRAGVGAQGMTMQLVEHLHDEHAAPKVSPARIRKDIARAWEILT